MIFKRALCLLLALSLALPFPVLAVDNYACSCDSGTLTMGDGTSVAASGDCVAGSGGNSGATASLPRVTFTDTQLNAAAPGDRFLFCKGGKWNNFVVSSPWRLPASTHAANPVILDSYDPPTGAQGQPILYQPDGSMIAIGNYNACNSPRGGYSIRNLHMHGSSTTGAANSNNFAIYGVGEIDTFQLLGNTITGFRDAVQMSAKSMYDDCNATTPGVYPQFDSNFRNFLIRDNNISYNYAHGMLTAGSHALYERNYLYRNNRLAAGGVHAIYYAGATANYANKDVTIRDNWFEYNSRVDPGHSGSQNGNAPDDGVTCRAGNLTMRMANGFRVYNNTVINEAAADTCYGVNVNTGYSFPEPMTDVELNSNTVVNPGGCGICLQNVQRSRAYNNRIIMLVSGQTSVSGAMSTLSGSEASEDQVSVDWRNNTLYLWGGLAINAQSNGSPTNQIVQNNLIYFWGGSGTRTAFQHDAKSTYAGFDYNLVYGASQFSPTYTTLGTEAANCPSGTASFDCHGVRANPLFVTTPSRANGFNVRVQAGSPAEAGSNTYCTRFTADGRVRTGTCRIGAF